MPTWPRAVFFDFDGVVVNSEPLHFQALQEVLAKENVALSEEEYYRDLIGFDDRGAIRKVFQTRDLPLAPKTVLSIVAAKSAVMTDLIHRKRLDALPGVEETVRTLWRRCPLAIVSGGLREEIELMLEGVALRDCFQFIVAAEDVTVGKPDPQGYLMAMDRVSQKLLAGDKARRPLKPSECLVVEDAPSVIRNVRKAGFATIGVATTYATWQLDDAKWVVETLKPDELARAVPELKLDEQAT